MKRVVVATGNRVAMGLSVDDALAQLYGGPIVYQQTPTLSGPPAAIGQTTAPTGAAQAPPATAAAPAPAPAAAAPTQGASTSGLSAADRQLLIQTVRSLQQRYDRLQSESTGIQEDLKKLLDALERGQ
jgi:uncharacterized membrane protein (UPF0182 family)